MTKRRGLDGWLRWKGWLGLLVVGLLLLPGMARAYDDPAVVRTARLAYFEGDVAVLRADNTGGDPAQLNMPLTEGVRISTGENGQAEIEFEDGSLVRVTPQSSVLLSRLGAGRDGSLDTEVVLLNGLVYADLRATSKYGYRVVAGGDTVTPVANLTVRILLDQPPAEVAVLDGTAHVSRANGGYRVDVGKGETLRGDEAASGRYFLSQQIEHNSWDDWNEEREQAAADALAARTSARDGYAGDQGYGWSDLDANGTWFDGTQGPVWQPFEASVSGFDPYGYGSWVYTTGPGYVWSSGYSWGWTPFRCGSWNYWQDFGWGWVPGGGCGFAGWGYGGGGGGSAGGGWGPGGGRRVNRINLSTVPPGYKRPLPPVVGGPVRVHPIVPVRTGPRPVERGVHAFEARKIAGTTVMPLRTLGAGYTSRGGSAVGASLRRDFPVDRATGQPLMGSVTVPAGRPVQAQGLTGTGQLGTGQLGTGQLGTGQLGTGQVRPRQVGQGGSGGDRRQARGGEGVRPVYPSARDGVAAPGSSAETGSGGRTTRPGYGSSGSNGSNGSSGSGGSSGSFGSNGSFGSAVRSSPAGASVPSPPPEQGVRVHPGDRVGDRGGRVEPSVPVMPPAGGVVRPAPPPSAPAPAMRSVPSAPAPAPVRSAPAAAPAAPPAAPAPKK